MLTSESEKNAAAENEVRERYGRFLKEIGREDLSEVLKPETPWLYWTMEMYRDDVRGQGGLGMLASDTLDVAKRAGVPATFVTPFYTRERYQEVEGFEQKMKAREVLPEERGFRRLGSAGIKTMVNGNIVPTELGIYEKQEGSIRLLTVTEPNFGELYQGENNSDHRLYQEVALGIGGIQALNEAGLKPAVNQLNEAPTIFSTLARLDGLVAETHDFQRALREIKGNTMYTNHTLVQAVEAEFSGEQFERFVMPNIGSSEVRDWLRNKIQVGGGRIKLSTLALELSGLRNGVSLTHALEASKTYKDSEGGSVEFKGVTNGISVERWGDPELLAFYREQGILDEFSLPVQGFEQKINELDPEILKEIKEKARHRTREYLKTRKNQYGQPVDIPESAKIFDWKRRIASYKRPGMMFENPSELARILAETDSYFVMAGKAHPSDLGMQAELKRIFGIVDRDPVLKQRVHFVQNYDEVLAHALAEGADVSINTPTVKDSEGRRVSTEACGTSWEKDILGNTMLISTSDGGVNDPAIRAELEGRKNFRPAFLEVSGDSYADEVASLYSQLEKAAKMSDQEKYAFLKQQAVAYLPYISGSRMEAEYLNFAFPK